MTLDRLSAVQIIDTREHVAALLEVDTGIVTSDERECIREGTMAEQLPVREPEPVTDAPRHVPPLALDRDTASAAPARAEVTGA
jgi:hypothetical protein